MTTKALQRHSKTQQRGSKVLERHSAPPLIEQLNNGNWLRQEEAEALRDQLFYQRAIHAYMTMLPALNTIGMRDGSERLEKATTFCRSGRTGWIRALGCRRPTPMSSIP